MTDLIDALEAATNRKTAVLAFIDVNAKLGVSAPDDFQRHVSQAVRSKSDTRAMGYLLLAALSLVPEGWLWGITINDSRDIIGPSLAQAFVAKAGDVFDRDYGHAEHAIPAAALVIAALRAMEADDG